VEVIFAPEGEGLARIAVPSVAAIAAIAGVAVVGIATGIAALLVTEPDDGPQRVLAVTGIIAGAVAVVATATSLVQRRRALSILELDGQNAELHLVVQLMSQHPKDARYQDRARRLLAETADSYPRLLRAGAVNEARRMLTARANAERVLASVQGAHE
jgi:hypothetical protein